MSKYPITPAVRALRAAGVAFTPHLYEYVEHGGPRASARALGVDRHAVIKTLVMEDDQRVPLLVLMHGDREVATGVLARALGVKSVAPCNPAMAQKHTGYLVGGTSPFGTRTPDLPVYAERTILALSTLYLNGGKRGFLVSLTPDALRQALGERLHEVEVAAPLPPPT
jgi:Cys-tRNA(Pro) deacylase